MCLAIASKWCDRSRPASLGSSGRTRSSTAEIQSFAVGSRRPRRRYRTLRDRSRRRNGTYPFVMSRVYNFRPGPAMLPLDVIEEVHRELIEFPGAGMSTLEISHRTPVFQSMMDAAIAGMRSEEHTSELQSRENLVC